MRLTGCSKWAAISLKGKNNNAAVAGIKIAAMWILMSVWTWFKSDAPFWWMKAVLDAPDDGRSIHVWCCCCGSEQMLLNRSAETFLKHTVHIWLNLSIPTIRFCLAKWIFFCFRDFVFFFVFAASALNLCNGAASPWPLWQFCSFSLNEKEKKIFKLMPKTLW